MNPMFQRFTDSLGVGVQQPDSWRQSTDAKGVTVAWAKLTQSEQLLPFAKQINELGGRLSTITAYQVSPNFEIAYHFDLDGSTVTAIVVLAQDGAKVPSLTPVFLNADWNEREFMELYDIEVVGHPNPRRLFIDENISPAVLQRYIPFSDLVNAASTKSLWEKIMNSRGEH